ncbi:MAG: zinc ABC transporter substrate-binding protein [Pseudomonadota bacterium]
MTSRRTLLTLGTALALSTLTLTTARASEPMPVVATFSILGDMVGRIGGEHVAVTTLVGPDGDAHVYQPTPADARSVADADLLFVNGLEFEGWLDRLVDASGFDGTRVVATASIEPIPFEEGGHDDHGEHGHDEHGHDDHAHGEHGHDDHGHDDQAAKAGHSDHGHGHGDHDHDHDDLAEAGHGDHGHGDHDHDHDEVAEAGHDDHDDHAHGGHHGHNHGAFDPHAWQSLDNAVAYVDEITAALAKADPANAAEFYQNRAAYVAEIEALDVEIREILAALPEDRRTVVTSHDAFGYFAEHYGLTFEAPQGLSTESEPSAADVAEMIEQIREEGISAVFVESITDNRLLQQIARETGATIGGTLYSDALSGPDGPASTYIDMMRHNANTLAAALAS